MQDQHRHAHVLDEPARLIGVAHGEPDWKQRDSGRRRHRPSRYRAHRGSRRRRPLGRRELHGDAGSQGFTIENDVAWCDAGLAQAFRRPDRASATLLDFGRRSRGTAIAAPRHHEDAPALAHEPLEAARARLQRSALSVKVEQRRLSGSGGRVPGDQPGAVGRRRSRPPGRRPSRPRRAASEPDRYCRAACPAPDTEARTGPHKRCRQQRRWRAIDRVSIQHCSPFRTGTRRRQAMRGPATQN